MSKGGERCDVGRVAALFVSHDEARVPMALADDGLNKSKYRNLKVGIDQGMDIK